jgi:hypothetical protein
MADSKNGSRSHLYRRLRARAPAPKRVLDEYCLGLGGVDHGYEQIILSRSLWVCSSVHRLGGVTQAHYLTYSATTISYFLVPCWVMTIVGWIRFRLTTKKNKSRSVQIALYIQHLATSAFVLVVCYGTPEFGTDPSQNGDRVVRIFVKVKTVSMPLRYACVVFSWVLLTVSRLFDAGIGRGIVLSMERRVPRWLFALALLSFFGAWVGNSEASLRDNHPQTGENAVSSVGQASHCCHLVCNNASYARM